jgi:hypothetical protein
MTHRLLVGLSALIALITIGAPIVSAQNATPTPGMGVSTVTQTNVHYIVPFTPDGLNAALTAATTEEGVCGFGSSAALDRPDAWDCISASNQIYDPCFENPYVPPDEPAQVACFDSPFTSDVTLLTLTEPLVREKEASSAGSPGASANDANALQPWDLPWAVDLANGDRCTLLHGTLIVIAGQTVNYGCSEGGQILGEVNHGSSVWTVDYLANGAYISALVDVVAAWS